MHRIFAIITISLIASTIVWSAWYASYSSALANLNEDAQRRLAQAVDQFEAQLSTARLLPTILARNANIVSAAQSGFQNERLKTYLIRTQELVGAETIRIYDTNGDQLFSSAAYADGQAHAAETSLTLARQGALGSELLIFNRERRLTFARSIIDADANFVGTVTVELALDKFDNAFSARPETILFLNDTGQVILSNRASAILTVVDTNQGQMTQLGIARSFTKTQVGKTELWGDVPIPGAPDVMLVVEQHLPRLSLRTVLLGDVDLARVQARKWVWFAIVALAFLGAIGLAIQQRRKRLITQLDAEQALTVELEKRVMLRTRELEDAQHQLVQAAKLSALGQMSAGISHELNQPIATIQNYAVMAKRFLDRGHIEDVQSNLEDIESQTNRMSRIIRNLRDFSRKDNAFRQPVELGDAARVAAKYLQTKLDEFAVTLHWHGGDKPLWVNGGAVRLQQVLVNLIENSIDAVSAQERREITIQLSQTDDTAIVQIIDTGHGLADPDRVFEPFYTTKSGPNDDGLGLGLSISFGFVESFGGTLRASNAEQKGACFTLSLPLLEHGDPS